MGANWTTADADWDLDTNTAENQTNQPAVIRTAAAAHADTADLKVQCTHGATGSDGGPVARATAGGATPTCYVADVFGTECFVHRYNGTGTPTAVGTAGTVSMVANGLIELEVSGTGGTVTLKAYYQSTLEVNTTDTSASRLTTAGRSGLHNWAPLSGADSRYDNFQVDDLVVATKARLAWSLQPQWRGRRTRMRPA